MRWERNAPGEGTVFAGAGRLRVTTGGRLPGSGTLGRLPHGHWGSGIPDSWAGGWLAPGGIDRHKARQIGGLRSSDLNSAHPQKAPVRIASEHGAVALETSQKLPSRANKSAIY
jgi:hypothetical protein